MPVRTTPLRSRILRVIAAAALMSGVLAFHEAIAPPEPVTATNHLCGVVADWECFTVTALVGGDGTGSVKTVDSSNNPDGRIDCRRSGNATTGKCTVQIRKVDGGVTLRFRSEPAEGSDECFRVPGPGGLTCSPNAGVRAIYENLTDGVDYSRASFRLQSRSATVVIAGAIAGATVTSSPAGISCDPTSGGPSTCTADFMYGTSLSLAAQPGPGAAFGSWTGSCAGQGATCMLAATAPVSTQAIFTAATPAPTRTAQPTLRPTANPTVAPTVATTSVTTDPTPTADPASEPSDPLSATGDPTTPDATSSGDTARLPSAAPAPTEASDDSPIDSEAAADDPPILVLALGLLALVGLALGGLRAAGFELRRRNE